MFVVFCRYVGFSQATTPILLIRDPELIKQIGIKDFDHFPEHQALPADGDIDPLWDKNLFGSKGKHNKTFSCNRFYLQIYSCKMEGIAPCDKPNFYQQ